MTRRPGEWGRVSPAPPGVVSGARLAAALTARLHVAGRTRAAAPTACAVTALTAGVVAAPAGGSARE